MSATMLQLIQQATGEMGLSVPTYIAGNTSTDVTQQLALLNACGYELLRAHPWQAINKQYILTVQYTTITGNTTLGSASLTNCSSIVGIDTTYQLTGTGINQATYVAAAPSGSTIVMSQPATSTNVGATYTFGKVKYAMPSDYDRQIDRTHWDKTKHWEMLGPETAQQWEWLISGYISTGPRIRYRIMNNQFQIWPIVTTNEVIGFEYVSNAFAADSGGAAKSSFTVDTDTCIFPDRLMVLALKKKYFEIKGFDTTAFTRDYMVELSNARAADAGSATLSFAPRISTILIGWEQIPDSGYGS
jgi:hypothetical protein